MNKLEKNYHLFPLPEFKTEGKDFHELIQDLTGPMFSKDLLKRVESATHKYGVNFLNNFYFLRQVYDFEKLNIDLIFEMDHSKAIDRSVIDQLDPLTFDFLFQGVDQIRVFDLITSAHEKMVYDIFALIDQNSKSENLKVLIPKSAQSFGEIHDAFQRYVAQLRNTNRSLDQKISYLQGKNILEFEIEVPSMSHDLYDSCKLLDEIFTYDIKRLASKVVSGEIQILYLIKNDTRIYAVELIPIPDGLRVNRIKGMSKEVQAEIELSKVLRENINKIIVES